MIPVVLGDFAIFETPISYDKFLVTLSSCDEGLCCVMSLFHMLRKRTRSNKAVPVP